MIRGHAINLLHIFDVPQKFKVMSLMIETIKRTAADQKRSCGYAPQIQELINSKMGMGIYLLDKEIPNEALDTFKFGSVHYLLSGLPTINWILRHT